MDCESAERLGLELYQVLLLMQGKRAAMAEEMPRD